MTQVDHQVKMTLISQLIKDLSRVLQKLLKHFNGTATLPSFILPTAEVFFVGFTLDLNKTLLLGKSTILTLLSKATSSL